MVHFRGGTSFSYLFLISLISGVCDADGFPFLCMDTGATRTTSPQLLHVFCVSLLELACFLMSRIYMLVRFRHELNNAMYSST